MPLASKRGRPEAGSPVLRILAIVCIEKRARHSFFPPNCSTCPARRCQKGGISLFKIAGNRRLNVPNAAIVTVMNDGARHSTKYGFDDVQKLRSRWERL